MRTALVTAVFWAYVVLALPVFFAGALAIFLVTSPFDRTGRLLHLYTCLWAVQYVWVFPKFRLRVLGRENIDRRGTYVLVSNHQSAGDIPVMFALFRHFKFVSKHQMFRVPFLGWNMFLNRYVRLVRGNHRSVAVMMATCRRWLDRGVSIMMFPEGTRSRDGAMLPFKAGAFILAHEAGVPVVPIVVDGTLDALPKDGILRGRRAHDIRLRIGAPIDSRSFADDRALLEAVRATMLRMQGEIRGEADPSAALDEEPAPIQPALRPHEDAGLGA